jgi:hypothetical protein
MRLSLRKRIFESGFRLIEEQMLRVNTKRQIQQKSLFRLVCELGPPEGQGLFIPLQRFSMDLSTHQVPLAFDGNDKP